MIALRIARRGAGAPSSSRLPALFLSDCRFCVILSRHVRAHHPAARTVRALPVVRAQVPVLRLQLLHAERRAPTAGVPHAASLRSRGTGAAGPFSRGRERVLRRRPAEPVLARGNRPRTRWGAAATAARARCGGGG